MDTLRSISSRHVSRRKVLAGSTAAAAAAMVTTPAARAQIFSGSGGGQVGVISQPPIQSVERAENLIIGTGYGGSVAALRLANAGRNVTMLERGLRWNKPGPDGKIFTKMIKPDTRSMWFRDRTRMPYSSFLGLDVVNKAIVPGPGVLEARDMGDISVYTGVGVGGGSLANGGMAPRPRRSMVSRELPQVNIDEFFATYLPRAEQELGVNMPTPYLKEQSEWYRFSRVGRKTAQRVGYPVVDVPNVYDFAYMEREARNEVPRSALDGQVIFGNDHGKRDLTKSYIKKAEETGRVNILPSHEAWTISRNAQGKYDVVVRIRDIDGATIEEKTIVADNLYLGAGSVGTTELLMRSREAGLLTDLASGLGDKWGPNGNVMFARQNQAWDWTGGNQSTIPIMGVDLWDTDTPCFAEIAPLPTGVETFAQNYLAITDTPERASFYMDGDQAKLTWRREQFQPGIAIARRAFDKINSREFTIYRSDLFGGGKQFSDDFTYHPLGGAILGTVTDNYGRVNGYDGLYVTDGALIPGILGVNPYLTITALAERLMDNVLARGR